MMRKKIIFYIGFLWGIFYLPLHIAVSQEEILSVEDSAFSKHTRPGVKFPHQKHTQIKQIKDCNHCHHVYQDGLWVHDADSIGMECSECHYKTQQDTILDVIRIYHLQCKGCHMAQKKGPVLCGQCHRKG